MIDVSPKDLAAVRRILAAWVPDCEVYAFGSRVTGTARPHSDLDLVIVGSSKLDRDTMRRLEEAFEESDLPIRVDVVDWHRVSDAFRDVISRSYQVVQPGPHLSAGTGGALESE